MSGCYPIGSVSARRSSSSQRIPAAEVNPVNTQFWLRFAKREIRIEGPETVIGRGEGCEIEVVRRVGEDRPTLVDFEGEVEERRQTPASGVGTFHKVSIPAPSTSS